MVKVDLSNKVAHTELSPVYFYIVSKKKLQAQLKSSFVWSIYHKTRKYILNGPGHITKMATMHICGKICWKSLCGYSLKVQSEI